MAAIYLIMLYLIAESYFLGAEMPPWLRWINEFRIIPVMMHLVTLITIVTGVQYLYENRHHLRSLGQFFFRIFAARNLAK
jgi:phosphatidylglycerophosphate synthase